MGSGAEQRGGHDRDAVAVAVGVAAGGDVNGVGEVVPQAVGEPSQMGGVFAVRRNGQLDLDI